MGTPAKPFGIIYLITNKVTGKQYVGQTVQALVKRWVAHVSVARKSPWPLGFAILKTGRLRPPEAVQKTADALRGRVQPRDQVERTASANRGKKRTPEAVARMKAGRLAASFARMATTTATEIRDPSPRVEGGPTEP